MTNAMTKKTGNEVSKLDDSYFQTNSKLGLEEVTQDDIPTPTLSLIQNNSTIVDDEGRPLPRGKFYYKETKSIMDRVECSMLVMTKKDMPSFSDKEKLEKTYVFLGALDQGKQPFLLYLKSSGIGAAKQYIGEITSLKKPMYALRTVLTAELVNGEKGNYYKVKFNVLGLREHPDDILLLEKLVHKYSPVVKEPTLKVADDLPFE